MTDLDLSLTPSISSNGGPPLDSSPVPKSDYDDLMGALTKAIEEETITLPVPARPGVTVTYKTHISREELSRWVEESRTGPDTYDDNVMFCLTLASKCKHIGLADGSPVLNKKGHELTFASTEIQEQYHSTGNALATVAAFYAVDADIANAATAVRNASRWGADVNPIVVSSSGS